MPRLMVRSYRATAQSRAGCCGSVASVATVSSSSMSPGSLVWNSTSFGRPAKVLHPLGPVEPVVDFLFPVVQDRLEQAVLVLEMAGQGGRRDTDVIGDLA